MIIRLDEYDVYDTISNIADICLIESGKPNKEHDEMYGWISIISDQTLLESNVGNLQKRARVTINLVGPLHPLEGETAESMISGEIDKITNAIVNEKCTKNNPRNGKNIVSVVEAGVGPMLYTVKNRPMRSVDYFITYIANHG